jgi:hypothetical protein
MFRNLLAMFATLSVGVTTASAAVAPATDQSLDQRLANAARRIELMGDGQQTAKPATGAIQLAHWCNYYGCYWNNWHNYWHNY